MAHGDNFLFLINFDSFTQIANVVTFPLFHVTNSEAGRPERPPDSLYNLSVLIVQTSVLRLRIYSPDDLESVVVIARNFSCN